LPRGPAVAIVGTREASEDGIAWTRKLAAELAAAGVAILSGGAEGIDTAAHEGALDAGGTTVVVTPAGFDHPYPEGNGPLYRRIVDSGGGYLSLFPDAVVATRAHFFTRNRYLIALAHAVIVTQTPIISGSRNAAKWARQLKRPLFVVPHSPWVAAGKGAIIELRLGALPLDRPKEVLKVLADLRLHALPPGRPPVKEGPIQTELWPPANDPAADPVLEAVRSGASHPDEIADRTGLPLATVQRRILTLTLSGVLVPGPLGSLKVVTI
jgi:DNA processing protein